MGRIVVVSSKQGSSFFFIATLVSVLRVQALPKFFCWEEVPAKGNDAVAYTDQKASWSLSVE